MGLIFSKISSKLFCRERNAMLASLSSTEIEDRIEAASFFKEIYYFEKNHSDKETAVDLKNFAQKTSLVKDLVNCLKEGEPPQLQKDAVWALTYVALSFDDESVKGTVFASGAIESICTLADQESNLELRDDAIGAVNYLVAVGKDEWLEAFLESRFLDVLLRSLQYNIQREKDAKESHIAESEQGSLTKASECDVVRSTRTPLRILGNLCVEHEAEIPFGRLRGVVPSLLYIIKNHGYKLAPIGNWTHNPEFLSDAFHILHHLVAGTPLEVAQMVEDNGDLCSTLVSLLYESNATLVAMILKILSPIYYVEPQALLDAGLLPAFCHMLRVAGGEFSPLQEQIWDGLDRLTEKECFIQAALYNDEFAVVIIATVMAVLTVEHGDQRTLRRAVKVLQDLATRGTSEQTTRLVKLGIFEALCTCWHRIKAETHYDEAGIQFNIFCAIEACLIHADKPSRREYCDLLDEFGIKELLDHAALDHEALGPISLSARAQQLKATFFSYPLVVETEGDGFDFSGFSTFFDEFHFFPRKRH